MNDWIDDDGFDDVIDERADDDMIDGGLDDDDDDSDMETDFADTLVFASKTESSDNVGGSSVELNVADLLAEVEAESHHGVDANGRVRRRLEAIMERKRRHNDLLDFDGYDLDS